MFLWLIERTHFFIIR